MVSLNAASSSHSDYNRRSTIGRCLLSGILAAAVALAAVLVWGGRPRRRSILRRRRNWTPMRTPPSLITEPISGPRHFGRAARRE